MTTEEKKRLREEQQLVEAAAAEAARPKPGTVCQLCGHTVPEPKEKGKKE